VEQDNFQLKLPEAETARLFNRVNSDYRAALVDHRRRLARWAEYYRRWRCLVDEPAQGEEETSNFPVPYIRAQILTALAKHMDAIFGDDAQIVAVPVGPSDYKNDQKIGQYMTWRCFNAMKLQVPFMEYETRKLLFGRTIAYSPWRRDTYDVIDPRDGEEKEIVDYEGPGFDPLWPDDIIVPAEDVRTIQDFSFVCRKYRVTPDQLLDGEEQGRYQGITKNWDKIITTAQRGQQRDFEGDEVKLEKDEAEGILYQRPLSSGEWLTVIEWHGRWRPLKGRKDASETDFKARSRKTKEYVVRVILELNLVIGVQDLQTLYPIMKRRRPFVESSLIKDGSYWGPGLCELLIDIEDELRANHNQATEAAQMGIAPPLGYRPATGMRADTIRLEPGICIPLDNPETDLVAIKITPDMSIAQWKEQATAAYGEKVTGMNDLQMGRQSDRPNAPRTAAQTQALLEEGNVRISLDTKILQADMALVLEHFWLLEYQFTPAEVFFRVTEEDADGMFDWAKGGSILSAEDRDGRYDFRLQFATSVWSKEVKKQQALARYQLDLQNPLIATNPQALWETTNQAHKALGDPNFADLVPKPPAPDIPIDPKQEWVNMLHGEDVQVNPMDNDQLHLIRHYKDIQTAVEGKLDPDALKKLIIHYEAQMSQLQAKKVQAAMMQAALQALPQGGGPGAGQPMPNGLFGGPLTIPPGDSQATGPFPFSGHPEVMHEQ
jgi:hypothetical protein